MANTPDDRLDSWKEIAGYLKRGVRTVQRWEHTHGLPVYRLEHERQGSVFAYRHELDSWWQSRQQNEPDSVVSPPKRSFPWILVTSVSLPLLIAGIYLLRPHTSAAVTGAPLDVVPLTSDLGTEQWPSFSPDGNQVAYAWNGPKRDNFDIYVKIIGSEVPLRLTTAPEFDGVPAWSPDGRQIAFVREIPKSEGGRLMVVPAIGGPEREIAEVRGGITKLAWSPDGRWILSGDSDGPTAFLVAIDVDTGKHRRLTTPPKDFGDEDPVVAPDASSLVFVRDLGPNSDLYRLRLSPDFMPAGEPERLTGSNGWNTSPVFTPDGQAIVYSSGLYEEHLGLWYLRLLPKPGPPTPLLTTGGQMLWPAISRQRNRLAFAQRRNLVRGTWVLDLTPDFRPEGKPRRLISSTHTDYNAEYSPDGRHLVFHSTRSGTSEIWISDADGEHALPLTRFKAPITGSPHWSPDGKWIVFDSNAGGQFNVYKIQSDGSGNPRQLTFGRSVDGAPIWSRDGRSIYFVSDRSGGGYQVWKINGDGGNVRQVTKNGGYLAVESIDSKWLYYTKRTGASPLYRMPVDGGEETQVLPEVYAFGFCLTDRGVLFESKRSLQILDFETGKTRQFVALEHHATVGLSISPDRRHVIFGAFEDEERAGESDLMLVEDFKLPR